MNMLGRIHGLKIIVPPPIEVRTRRSWVERLFTRPWRPLVTHNISWKETIEGEQVIKTRDSLLMNRETYEMLKSTLEQDCIKEPEKYSHNGGGFGWTDYYRY